MEEIGKKTSGDGWLAYGRWWREILLGGNSVTVAGRNRTTRTACHRHVPNGKWQL
uniref:Uncharacterized protein n=1 Tax=Oryza sativa subsp. japonica TaxID=39947 RepID=Q6YTI1_ORYSJ|nr:hypothetical protein [Oryza sativa Japonica Group]